MLTQKSIKLSDYIVYPFQIPNIDLDFNVGKEEIIVQSTMIIKPIVKDSSKLIFKGNQIKLCSILIDGRELESYEYILTEHKLIIDSPLKSEYKLKIKSKINPFLNTSLEGLYLSSGMLTTQCEAEGFRSICYHPDRPDDFVVFTCIIRTLIPRPEQWIPCNGESQYIFS